MSNLPHGWTRVETSLGPVQLTISGEWSPYHEQPDHVTAFATAIRHEPFVVNTVDYNINIRLKHDDGWTLIGGAWEAISGTRTDWITSTRSYQNSGLTRAARDKVREIVVPEIIAWLESHPDEILAARRATARSTIANLTEELERKESECASLRRRIDEIAEDLNAEVAA